MNKKPQKIKRILTIDGGGVKGAFAASLLSDIQEAIDKPINQYFDLIAGTSTGGIIALGLGLDIPISEISDMYKEKGADIFPFSQNRMRRTLQKHCKKLASLCGRTAKYDSRPLKEILQEKLSNKKLGHSTNRLLIPSWSQDSQDVHVYKTAHHERFERDYKILGLDVAMSTSAAPTYFLPHLVASGQTLSDGGIYANNPIAMAVVEALSVLKWNKDSIRILRVGAPSIPPKKMHKGYANLHVSTLIDCILHAQSTTANAIAKLLLDDRMVLNGKTTTQKIWHCNPPDSEIFELDDARKIPQLVARGQNEARKQLPKIKNIFFTQRAEKFEPHISL